MGYLVSEREGCRHKWKKVDKDDGFNRKRGKYLIKRIFEECIHCGEERIRHVKKRVERSDIHGKRYY